MMTELLDGRKAGKLGKLPGQQLLTTTLRDYMKVGLPSTPATVDYGPRVSDYPMALNDRLGICTVAGIIHLLQLAYAEIGEVFAYPGDVETQSTYFGLTGGQDSGCVETSVLQTWSGPGLFDTKAAAWVPVNVRDKSEMQAAIYLFGGVYLGVELPQSAQVQFEAQQPWHLTIPRGRPVGGHCIVGSGYNREGIDIITWGKETTMTWDWWEYYGSEAYAIIPQAFVEADHGPVYKIDILQLQADLKLL
jgi:hypothetical protein